MNKSMLTLAAIWLAASSVLLSPAMAQGRGGDRGPANVFVEVVKKQEFSNRLEALGTLEPKERVELSLNAADRVSSLYFEDGQRVTEGKTLLLLARNEQSALVEAAEATENEAKQQLERLTRLVEQKAVSQSELDQARRNADNASAQRRAVQARLADRVLVAPFDGVLGFRRVSVGSYVRPGDVVATLIDDSEMRLEFSVPSLLLSSLTPGTKVSAITDDLPGEVFSGELTSIDNAIDPVTRSVRVRATLPNEQLKLKAGMFMMVEVKAKPRMTISVAEGSIQPLGPKSYVYVVEKKDDNLVALRQEVTIGARQNGRVEIVAGLVDGETIITEGIIGVRDGGPVKVIEQASVITPAGSAPATGTSAAAASVR